MPADDGIRLPLTAVEHPDRAFARSVTCLRLARGWTKRQLAAESGITVAAIFNIESGRNGPNLRTAWALAEALEASLDAMVRGEVPVREPRAAERDWPGPVPGQDADTFAGLDAYRARRAP